MTGKLSAQRISDEEIARIRERMLELGEQISDFRAALDSYQSGIRRALVQRGDTSP